MTATGTVRRTPEGRVEIRFDRRFAHPLAVASGWHAGLEILAAALDARPIGWDVWRRAADLQPLYEELS